MQEAYKFLDNLINDKDTVVAGVSGGPDSMALLHLLIKLRDKKKIDVICAHVNHNIRTESEDEAKFLESFCGKNEIKFEMTKIEEYSNDNFENEARIKRYNFFNDVVLKHKALYLLTAHHGDDLVETILMRLVRGSTFKGYAGFAKIVDKGYYKILRPLINTTKDDIIKYNKENKLDYVIDITNTTDKYTRNRYRKYILPFLKNEDADVHEKFLKFSQLILKYNEYIDYEMKKNIDSVYKDNVLDIDSFIKLNKLMQERIINFVMDYIYLDDVTLINDSHTQLIMKLIESSKPNSYIYLPNNIKVLKAYNKLSFLYGNVDNENYEMELDRFMTLPNGHVIEMIDDNNENSNFICRLDSNEVALPLYVRTKKTGDRMEIKNMGGSKKIKDIFIDAKIDTINRQIWPILVDKKGKILWLPGLKKSKYDKSKEESYDIIIKYH